ncbi:MAG: PqqD family protein [Clostridiales bacterium]|nr:PqqD family protein [Clostridiales bacterium]
MKLSPNFLIHVQDDEHLLIPVSDAKFSGVVRGNKTFGAILSCLKEETTEEQIVASLKAQFEGADEEVIKADVAKALSELSKIEAITN